MAVFCQSKATLYEVLVLGRECCISNTSTSSLPATFADMTRISTHLVKYFPPAEAALGLCPSAVGTVL